MGLEGGTEVAQQGEEAPLERKVRVGPGVKALLGGKIHKEAKTIRSQLELGSLLALEE